MMSGWVERFFGDRVRDRRKAARIRSRLNKVEIDRHVFQVVNWSTGGFLLSPYEGSLKQGDLVDIRFWLHTENKGRIDFPARCRVVRLEPNGLAAQFVSMADEFKAMLERRKGLKDQIVERRLQEIIGSSSEETSWW